MPKNPIVRNAIGQPKYSNMNDPRMPVNNVPSAEPDVNKLKKLDRSLVFKY